MRQMFARLGEKPIKIWNFWENLKITYKNLNGKLIFGPFSLQSSKTFVNLYNSWTNQNCGVQRVILKLLGCDTFEVGGSINPCYLCKCCLRTCMEIEFCTNQRKSTRTVPWVPGHVIEACSIGAEPHIFPLQQGLLRVQETPLPWLPRTEWETLVKPRQRTP